MHEENYVTASEIGEYVYCKRSWWLRWNKMTPETDAMRLGTKEHNRLAKLLGLYKRRIVIAWVILIVGLLLLIGYFLMKSL